MELPGKRELREQILHQMDGRTSYVSDKDVYREIDKAILRSSHGGYGTLSEKEELRRQMFYSIRGYKYDGIGYNWGYGNAADDESSTGTYKNGNKLRRIPSGITHIIFWWRSSVDKR